jgi:hypothetical protein
MRAALAIAAAGVLTACTVGPLESKGTDAAQADLQYAHWQAVAADVAAIIEGMAAAEGQARAELVRRAKP